MSGKKQVIHVKDLVIKADNVILERPHRHDRDPFFGSNQDHDKDEKEEADSREHRDPFSVRGHNEDKEDDESPELSEHHQQRDPFSWFTQSRDDKESHKSDDHRDDHEEDDDENKRKPFSWF